MMSILENNVKKLIEGGVLAATVPIHAQFERERVRA
jgi:hypothetical protein